MTNQAKNRADTTTFTPLQAEEDCGLHPLPNMFDTSKKAPSKSDIMAPSKAIATGEPKYDRMYETVVTGKPKYGSMYEIVATGKQKMTGCMNQVMRISRRSKERLLDLSQKEFIFKT
jgi:hypothetical protein